MTDMKNPEKLITRFLTVFGEPKSDDPQKFLEEYLKALQGFSAEDLQQAANDLIERQNYKTWPTIAEAIEAAKRARQKLAAHGDIPPADTKGTGWRVSSNTGAKWYRIERGSDEFLEWMKFFRQNGKQAFANFTLKHGYTFVKGPSPYDHNYGSSQISFMNAQNIGGNS